MRTEKSTKQGEKSCGGPCEAATIDSKQIKQEDGLIEGEGTMYSASLGEVVREVQKTGNCLFVPEIPVIIKTEYTEDARDPTYYSCMQPKNEKGSKEEDKNTDIKIEEDVGCAIKPEPCCFTDSSIILTKLALDRESGDMQCKDEVEDEQSPYKPLHEAQVAETKALPGESPTQVEETSNNLQPIINEKIQRPYSCSICKGQYMHMKSLSKHLKVHKRLIDGTAYVIEQQSRSGGDLEEGIIYRCSECDKTSKVKPTMRRHCKRHSGIKPFRCSTCEMDFTEARYLDSHTTVFHSDERPYPCDLCEKRFKTLPTLQSHIHVHSGLKPYECDKCGQKCSTSSSLGKHERDVHQKLKNYVCDVCEQAFSASSSLIQHRRLRHTGERPYECDLCKKRFAVKFRLVIHKRIHTGERPHVCNICNKRFRTRNKLVVHVGIHSEEKNFECKNCGKAYKTRKGLKTHMLLHENKREYECRECGKRYNLKTSLDAHVKKQHSLVRASGFQCTVCSRILTTKNTLKDHMNTHSAEKPFKCELCPNSYASKYGLKGHIEAKHGKQGETPKIKKRPTHYVCKTCDGTFSSFFHLKRHGFVHGEGFACETCGKRFITRTLLDQHMVMHGIGDGFPCELCNKTFARKLNLHRHNREIHPDNRGSFTCKLCPDKTFSAERYLKRHMKEVHSNQEVCSCLNCNKEFRGLTALKQHMKTHTGDSTKKRRRRTRK